MTEHIYTHTAHRVVTCDSCGRVDRSRIFEDHERRQAILEHGESLDHEGWRVYVGRNRRNYCPNCEPTSRHKMRLLPNNVRP